jgi:nucleosome binding factor SPN SPT16 subunit
MPTVNCLVELTEMPFTVISIADIEIVNLERVGFNLKNFDLAIVQKVGIPFRQYKALALAQCLT